MIFKTFSSISFTLLSFVYYLWYLLFDDGVTARLNIPETIKPGETIVAEVIINKGNTGGFAKLQIDIGQGLSVAEEDSKGAAFSFSGNTAKWIWTALPMQSEFKVKFKVTANAGTSGSSTISGKFSYILNNAKQVVDVPTKTIQISDKPAETLAQNSPPPTHTETTSITTPTTEVNNTNTVSINSSTNVQVSVNTETVSKEATTNTSSTETTPIQISRTIENIAANAWLIKINIQKGNVKGFARYNDVLPAGLKATVEEKDGSSFFIDGNTIKFVWSSLPEKNNLQISYKLAGNITSPITLNGDFSYTENNQVITKNLSPDLLQPSAPISATSPTTTTSEPAASNIAENSIQAKQTIVWFSVQLGAFLKSKIGKNYFINKYTLQDVKIETHESYRKFYSGSFQEYKQARDYREEVKLKGIQDAFVIAHKNQVRITVQEALMITNQKWYP